MQSSMAVSISFAQLAAMHCRRWLQSTCSNFRWCTPLSKHTQASPVKRTLLHAVSPPDLPVLMSCACGVVHDDGVGVVLQAHKVYLEGTEHRTAAFNKLTQGDASAAHVIEQRMKKLIKLQVGAACKGCSTPGVAWRVGLLK